MATIRKQTPYIFHSQTTSMCEECFKLVPTKVIIENNDVYYLKRCPEHGVQKTKISTDADYFKSTKDFIKPGDRPLTFQTKTDYGCPLDCGLCPDHEQHSCVALIEINEECNLSCPVCFADSSPSKSKNLSLVTIENMLEALVKSEGEPDVLQISGGEPTIHPDIIDILKLCKTKPIRHLMINTNGIRIAQDEEFVKELAKLSPGFEIYLQFDSLQEKALKNLRGANLIGTRKRALKNLEKYNISTSLVVTVKKGVNDTEIGSIIDYSLNYKCIRGITFQPIQDAGRNEHFDKNNDRFLLSDIRKAIYTQNDHFSEEDIIPLPCNPESIGIGYALKSKNKITPITSMFPKEELIKTLPNAVSFEKQPDLRQKVIDLFSLSSGDLNTVERMESLLCCLPQIPAIENLSYENIFRISIVQFLDRYNFCIGNVKRSCIHFVTEDGKIIPFDTYNLLYRNGNVDKLRKKGAL